MFYSKRQSQGGAVTPTMVFNLTHVIVMVILHAISSNTRLVFSQKNKSLIATGCEIVGLTIFLRLILLEYSRSRTRSENSYLLPPSTMFFLGIFFQRGVGTLRDG